MMVYFHATSYFNILSNCEIAAAGGHDKIVKLLLEDGADILVQTETGLCGTALHYAAGKGHYECVRYF